MFPIEVEYVYTETINALKPNFKYALTYAQACDLVSELEKEMRDNLGKLMQVASEDTTSTNALEAINENDDEYEDEYESDSYEQTSAMHAGADEDENKHLTNYPRAGYEDDEGENEDLLANKAVYGQNHVSTFTSRLSSSAGAGAGGTQSSDDNDPIDLSDKEDINVVLQSRAKAQVSKEDEDFIKAFDSVVVENVTVSMIESNRFVLSFQMDDFRFS